MHFFVTLSLFEKFALSKVKQIYLNSSKITYKKNDFVFKEYSNSDAIFIVLSGEFSAVKHFEYHIDEIK